MKKIILVVLCLFFAGFTNPLNIDAQVSPSEACGPGFENGGCFFCSWNGSTQACEAVPSTSESGKFYCTTGYDIDPDPAKCSAMSESGEAACNTSRFACRTDFTAKAFCVPVGGASSCKQCDNDPSTTAFPDCPNECARGQECDTAIFDNLPKCLTDCSLIKQTCQSQGGQCQSSCGSGEDDITPGTSGCQAKGAKCCRRQILPDFVCVNEEGNGGIKSAIGCIPIENIDNTTAFLLLRGVMVAGGIAFLLMVSGLIQLITSGGEPDKLQSGRQLVTAAISGLVMIIFSIFLLRLLGVNILGLIQ